MGLFGQAERAAWEELFTVQYPRLAGWVRGLVGDEETAHEIASESFTRAMSRLSRLDNPQAYLYRVAANLVRDHWRRTERERRAMRTVAAAARDETQSAPDGEVDMRTLVEHLPVRLRTAVLLYYYGGFGVREVATILNRPEGTVKADLFRARAYLRDALDGSA